MPASLINDDMLDTMRELASGAPPGALVEVGVYKGGSAAVLYEVAQQQGRELYLYDSFEGMPVHGPLDQHRVGEFADTSAEDVQALFPEAIVCAGIFPASLMEMGPVAFVHADADQYQTTFDICHKFSQTMVAGGAMLFDDYGVLNGCRVAVDECFPDRELLLDGRAIVRF